ncbi:hypothetical protein D187_001726 [Cystobacter fuscus DSM 2262]|uniref:Uncharacterized protein n=1 Tax=Cystobacter fuscus (strain ATCC 25194 / DSM 2262 / NBRC 100088 / M29) TaxID=1242864 RepID=S9PE18_CYSF2|nr:carotenoid oxygenase family protein [Cystobacter fuscus]EPX60572.1 hypothetical protein D187_001726 [Cystobacter fuscus DSM 2262]
MSVPGKMMRSPGLPPGTRSLDVREGAWPSGLSGHTFVVGPTPLPGLPFFFGPGAVHRLDLAPGEHGLSWHTGHLMTEGLQVLSQLPPELLKDPRFPPLFGPVPNAANTALVPIQDGRMLATFDAGRPVEFDPRALTLLTPVGALREWKVSVPGVVQPLVQTPAHPFFDPFESRLYTLNTTSMPRQGTSLAWSELDTWLCRWDGEGAVHRWHVSGLSFAQYTHEVLATRSFLVWTDSAVYPQEPGERWGLPRTRPQKPYTDIAIVRKRDLLDGARDVEARVVRVPLEGAHIFADYDDDGERLCLWLAHANSVELPTVVAPGDVNAFSGEPVDPSLYGLFTQADLNPFGRYVIHVESGEVESHAQVLDPKLWGLGLFARDQRPDALRAHRVAWLTYSGFEPGALTRRMLNLYGDHPYRVVPVERMPREREPSTLVRVDLEGMRVTDGYTLDAGRIASSPTWIPGEAGGWLQVLVWSERDTEVWLFRADRLSEGPVARLGAEGFQLPYTLHTAWLPALSERTSRYRVDFAEDIGPDYQRLPPPVREAVERVVASQRASVGR